MRLDCCAFHSYDLASGLDPLQPDTSHQGCGQVAVGPELSYYITQREQGVPSLLYAHSVNTGLLLFGGGGHTRFFGLAGLHLCSLA